MIHLNYPQAVLVGKLALVMIAVAMLFYLLDLALKELRRRDAPTAACVSLGAFVALARATHPYLSSLISAMAAYHVYVMWMTYAMSAKMWSGLILSATVLFMANSGWALKARPRSRKLRRVHRAGMAVMLLLTAVHKFI